MDELLSLLAAYVEALKRGSATTSPKEQAEYERRLVAAGQLGVALQNRDAKELKRLIDQEAHAAGWGFLVGSHGAAAEETFAKFEYRARMSGATFAA